MGTNGQVFNEQPVYRWVLNMVHYSLVCVMTFRYIDDVQLSGLTDMSTTNNGCATSYTGLVITKRAAYEAGNAYPQHLISHSRLQLDLFPLLCSLSSFVHGHRAWHCDICLK